MRESHKIWQGVHVITRNKKHIRTATIANKAPMSLGWKGEKRKEKKRKEKKREEKGEKNSLIQKIPLYTKSTHRVPPKHKTRTLTGDGFSNEKEEPK